MSRPIKLFYATDIHGSERCFRKFINAGQFYGADVLIMGGDVTGKMIVPIVEETAGHFVAEIFGRLHADPAKVQAAFKKLMSETVTRWLDFAEERLAGTQIVCLVSPGNDDQPFIDDLLSSSERVINPEGRVVLLPGELELVSLGFSNRTPWDSPRELDEPELLARIDKIADQVTRPDRTIFNLHVPPKDSSLDEAIILNADLSPVIRNGSAVVGGVGSTAVRDAIERHQPLLGLHGHIHESRGLAKVGRTTVFNPGSEYSDGVLRGLIVTVEAGKGIRGHQFVAG